MEIVYVFFLLLGIEAVTDDDTGEQPEPKQIAQVEEGKQEQRDFVFNLGNYYQSKFGYYISNLSDKPCERKPILIADLTLPADEVLKVNQIELGCING